MRSYWNIRTLIRQLFVWTVATINSLTPAEKSNFAYDIFKCISWIFLHIDLDFTEIENTSHDDTDHDAILRH